MESSAGHDLGSSRKKPRQGLRTSGDPSVTDAQTCTAHWTRYSQRHAIALILISRSNLSCRNVCPLASNYYCDPSNHAHVQTGTIVFDSCLASIHTGDADKLTRFWQLPSLLYGLSHRACRFRYHDCHFTSAQMLLLPLPVCVTFSRCFVLEFLVVHDDIAENTISPNAWCLKF